MNDREPPDGPDRPVALNIQGGAATAGKVIGFLVFLALFFYLLRAVLLPFVLAGIVAYVCSALIAWLRPRLPVPRWVLAVAVLIAVIALSAGFALLAGPPLIEEFRAIAGNFHGLLESLFKKVTGGGSLDLLGSRVDARQAADYLVKTIRQWFSQDARLLTATALLFSSAFGLILAFVLLGYFLIDGPRIFNGVRWLVPPSYRPFADRTWSELDPILKRYFGGIALVVLYASVAAYIGLGFALGLKHAVVLALLTGFLEVIPLVGPAASALIAGFVAVQESKGAAGIVAYIFYAIALRISIDEFFGPLVLGRAGKIPPILVIFCFLAGGVLFGIVGVVLAVPAALTIRVILRVLYDEAKQPDSDAKS